MLITWCMGHRPPVGDARADTDAGRLRMQGDDEQPKARLGTSGLMHTLARLIEETASLQLPLTENALRSALRLCRQELEPDPAVTTAHVPSSAGMIH